MKHKLTICVYCGDHKNLHVEQIHPYNSRVKCYNCNEVGPIKIFDQNAIRAFYELAGLIGTLSLFEFENRIKNYKKEFIHEGHIKKEYILCAAILFDNGNYYEHQPINIKRGIVLCGWRHHCIFMQRYAMNNELKEIEQGFLTNTNRFVSREEAAKIAFKSRQITKEKKTLFSEDVW